MYYVPKSGQRYIRENLQFCPVETLDMVGFIWAFLVSGYKFTGYKGTETLNKTGHFWSTICLALPQLTITCSIIQNLGCVMGRTLPDSDKLLPEREAEGFFTGPLYVLWKDNPKKWYCGIHLVMPQLTIMCQ